jgi:hypothetical protein
MRGMKLGKFINKPAGTHMSKRRSHLLLIFSVLLATMCPIHGYAEDTTTAGGPARCTALLSASFADVQDAPTQITRARWVQATQEVPAYCDARGYITPNVGIELKLPINWNGKFLEMGCGGLCGVLFSSYSENEGHDCDQGLRKGYSCIASDQGHQSSMVDGLWAYNNPLAQIDYAYRAAHVAALAGKAVTEHYYGHAPQKSYFWGCSGGGRQALVEAQKFPWDFDGIVSVAPGIHLSSVALDLLWNARAATENGQALFTPADVKWLHRAVVAQCDSQDGLKDGVIGSPVACKIDPSQWICKSEQKVGCLSPVQAEAVKKIYAGPTDSRGRKLYAGGAVPGEEEGSIPTSAELWGLPRDFFRYLGFTPAPGPAWKADAFDFDRDPRRLTLAQALLEDANPDLRLFKGAGAKLILVHGWADEALSPYNTIDYYETVEKTMGGRQATQDFLRLFLVPGMNHCGDHDGEGAYAIDYLSNLEGWTERGQSPQTVIAAHIKEGYTGWDFKLPAEPANIAFARPVYPYPLRAKYKGRGSPNDASNFEPVE